MLSLQKIFGKDDKFFALLEASAESARKSVKALTRVLSTLPETAALAQFHEGKEADKRITEEIGRELVSTFATELEREDIEVLSTALYKIPKTVEKIAERFQISLIHVRGVDFSKQATLLDAATRELVEMVKLLRNLGAGQFNHAKELNRNLQNIEGEADKLILAILADLYSGRHEATKVIALKDIHELIEKVVDRCRDAGNVITHIVLKNS
jgi:uncharacterized protein Yka (UPF0111/DUF47 family)